MTREAFESFNAMAVRGRAAPYTRPMRGETGHKLLQLEWKTPKIRDTLDLADTTLLMVPDRVMQENLDPNWAQDQHRAALPQITPQATKRTSNTGKSKQGHKLWADIVEEEERQTRSLTTPVRAIQRSNQQQNWDTRVHAEVTVTPNVLAVETQTSTLHTQGAQVKNTNTASNNQIWLTVAGGSRSFLGDREIDQPPTSAEAEAHHTQSKTPEAEMSDVDPLTADLSNWHLSTEYKEIIKRWLLLIIYEEWTKELFMYVFFN